MESIKRYRAFYIHPITHEKVYIKNGKFYKTIGQCKSGIRTMDWSTPKNSMTKYIIEEYDVKWSADVVCAYVERGDGWKVDVHYEKVD